MTPLLLGVCLCASADLAAPVFCGSGGAVAGAGRMEGAVDAGAGVAGTSCEGAETDLAEEEGAAEEEEVAEEEEEEEEAAG